MAITTTQGQQLYIAYFGRPADPSGLNFWTQADSTNTMQQQSNAFATAPEWTSAIAGMTNDQIVNLIYINSFGRSPEPEGLRFWSDAITNGILSVGCVFRFKVATYSRRMLPPIPFQSCH